MHDPGIERRRRPLAACLQRIVVAETRDPAWVEELRLGTRVTNTTE